MGLNSINAGNKAPVTSKAPAPSKQSRNLNKTNATPVAKASSPVSRGGGNKKRLNQAASGNTQTLGRMTRTVNPDGSTTRTMGRMQSTTPAPRTRPSYSSAIPSFPGSSAIPAYPSSSYPMSPSYTVPSGTTPGASIVQPRVSSPESIPAGTLQPIPDPAFSGPSAGPSPTPLPIPKEPTLADPLPTPLPGEKPASGGLKSILKPKSEAVLPPSLPPLKPEPEVLPAPPPIPSSEALPPPKSSPESNKGVPLPKDAGSTSSPSPPLELVPIVEDTIPSASRPPMTDPLLPSKTERTPLLLPPVDSDSKNGNGALTVPAVPKLQPLQLPPSSSPGTPVPAVPEAATLPAWKGTTFAPSSKQPLSMGALKAPTQLDLTKGQGITGSGTLPAGSRMTVGDPVANPGLRVDGGGKGSQLQLANPIEQYGFYDPVDDAAKKEGWKVLGPSEGKDFEPTKGLWFRNFPESYTSEGMLINQ